MSEAGEQTTARRRTWRKSADKPKHPLNAYNVFFQFERERILYHKSHAPINVEEVAKIRISQEKKKRTKGKQKQESASGCKVGFADLARTIASKWKQLDDEVKAAFAKHAKQEKIRYKQELEQWAQTKVKEDAGKDTVTAAPQLDDDSSLSIGTLLPLQMEDETTAPRPDSPLMFEAKPDMEVPRTIAFGKNRKGKPQSSSQGTHQDTEQRRLGLGHMGRPSAFSPQANNTGALQEQMGISPNAIRYSMVSPPQDHGALEGHNRTSSSVLNEEQVMRKLKEHCMKLITAKFDEMETNRISHPTMPRNMEGGAPCCASCMSKTDKVNDIPNPNMFHQGPQMGNMSMKMAHASLQVMHNNGMMGSPAGFGNFGPNTAAAGFAWEPVSMQSRGMPAANGLEFPPNCFTTNRQANSCNGPERYILLP